MFAHQSIRKVGVAILFAAVGTQVAQAAVPEISCVGNLSTVSGAHASIQCSGALTLTGGSLSFDDSLDVAAGTSLDLLNVTLVSHDISLTAPTSISIDALSRLGSTGTPAGSITLTSTNIRFDGDIVAPDGKVAFNSYAPATQGNGTIAVHGTISVGGNNQVYVAPTLIAGGDMQSGGNLPVLGGGSLTLTTTVPEPNGLALIAVGLIGIGVASNFRAKLNRA